jgi:hypothetical protein
MTDVDYRYDVSFRDKTAEKIRNGHQVRFAMANTYILKEEMAGRDTGRNHYSPVYT